jgi:hypothetical protein
MVNLAGRAWRAADRQRRADIVVREYVARANDHGKETRRQTGTIRNYA